MLTLQIPAGKTELTSATLTYTHYSPSVDDYLTASTEGTIHQNVIRFDLSSEVATDLLYFIGTLAITDGCGAAKEIGVVDQYLYLEQIEGAGGAPSVDYDLTCDF